MINNQKKYFILDGLQKVKQVSQKIHSTWEKENAKKYNREFHRKDGTKDVTQTFIGIKEVGKELVLFNVNSIFKSYDGEIVSDNDDEFSELNEAIEQYEQELLINGDIE